MSDVPDIFIVHGNNHTKCPPGPLVRFRSAYLQLTWENPLLHSHFQPAWRLDNQFEGPPEKAFTDGDEEADLRTVIHCEVLKTSV